MMLPTHVLIGGLSALSISALVSQPQTWLIIVGMTAAILPDLDIFIEHRKTLHRPKEYIIGLGLFSSIFFLNGSSLSLYLTVFFLGLISHIILDLLAYGKTMNPDLKEDGRCMYDHLSSKWIKPLKIAKPGSKKDLILGTIASIPLLLTENTIIIYISISNIVIGTLFVYMMEWITENLLSDYDRFSEAIQQKIGLGPEVA